MPIPHEVTKEFFVPEDDLPLFNDELLQNGNQTQNRINDLMFLFNLLSSAFGRNQNNENSSTESSEQPNNGSEIPEDSVDKTTEQSAENTNEDNAFNHNRPN